MDCYFFIVVTIIIFFLMLFFPQTAICGASLGLMLWFQTVLPVLLPFLILTALLLKSNGFFLISRLVRPILRPLFGISDYGSFALLVGFLCGYPMGSKVTADLKREGKITVNEASYLLSFCNQTSPMFLISYIFYIHLKRPDLLFPGMLLIEGVPILMSIRSAKYTAPLSHPALLLLHLILPGICWMTASCSLLRQSQKLAVILLSFPFFCSLVKNCHLHIRC